MGTVMIVIGIGLFCSLLVFFVCEEKSLADANFSDMKCLVTKEAKVSECFTQYKTIQYSSYYFIFVMAFTMIIAYFVYIPHMFGLQEILAYTFITSLMGSALILLVKWNFNPVIKLFSSFMFGSMFMGGTAFAFSFVYLLN